MRVVPGVSVGLRRRRNRLDLKARIARIMTQRPGTHVSLAGKMLLSAAAMVAVAGPLSFGVLHAMQANMPLLHPTAGQQRSFEVATIKPNNETHPGFEPIDES